VKNLYLFLGVAALTLNSCQRDIYIPDHIYTPTYTRAGEATLDLSSRLQRSDRILQGVSSDWSFSADAGYAITDHFGMFVSYRDIYNKGYVPAVRHFPDEVKLINSQRFDIAAGYYKHEDGILFGAYGGVGGGYTERSGQLYYGNYSVRHERLFAQLSGGVGGNIAWFLTGMKFTAQRYHSFKTATPDIRDTLMSGEFLDIDHKSVFFGEPFIQGRVGYKKVHFTTQLGISAQLGGTPVSDYLFLPPYLTIGIDFNFPVGKKAKLPVTKVTDDGKKTGINARD
jgi:hypothetical protein